METPWAAVKINPDGTVGVFVHNWIRAGTAANPQELWALVHEAWSSPEKFWSLFYESLAQERGVPALKRAPVDPRLANLTVDDLGI